MLHDAFIGPEDNLEIDGSIINDIIVVGRVISRTEESMRVVFEINDNTATFKVIFYQKDASQPPTALKEFGYKQFSYVKIFGNIRVYKEEKAIVGINIRRLENFDELSNHLLATFVSHQMRSKGVLTSQELSSSQSNVAKSSNGAPSQLNLGVGKGGGNIESLMKTIINIMREMMTRNKLVHKRDIYAVVSHIFDQQFFDNAMKRLLDDGAVFTTYDNDILTLDE